MSAAQGHPDEQQRAARITAVTGTLVILAYAAASLLEIFVLGPLEGVPGRTLAQIHRDLAAAGEAPMMTLPAIAMLTVGGLAAAAVMGVTVVHRRMTWLSVALTHLGLLVLGAPALALASFGPGMALADTYGASGAEFHTVLTTLLYGVSGAALLAFLVLCAILTLDAMRSSSPEPGSPPRRALLR